MEKPLFTSSETLLAPLLLQTPTDFFFETFFFKDLRGSRAWTESEKRFRIFLFFSNGGEFGTKYVTLNGFDISLSPPLATQNFFFA